MCVHQRELYHCIPNIRGKKFCDKYTLKVKGNFLTYATPLYYLSIAHHDMVFDSIHN